MAILMAAQIWFASDHRNLRHAIEEMPPAPSGPALKFMALGDDEFLFRHLGRWLEMVGDGGGRVRPLRDYDYDRVVAWMETLDELDRNRSDFIHEIAARYFGEITSSVDQGNARLRKIVGYLRVVALHDPARFWRWLVWDAQKARKPINDPELIEMLARDLQSPELVNPLVPAWVRILPIKLYQVAGNQAAAQDALAKASPKDIAEVEEMRRRMAESFRKLLKLGGGADAPVLDEPQQSPQSRP